MQLYKNPAYIFDRYAKLMDISTYKGFLLRLAYLSKVRTKHVGDGQRNLGCSQS
uniref:YagK/YfjJ domain-containing protein n=1 Tax=Aeromonas hydrophila TaxID=644 RepID=UPI003467081A